MQLRQKLCASLKTHRNEHSVMQTCDNDEDCDEEEDNDEDEDEE